MTKTNKLHTHTQSVDVRGFQIRAVINGWQADQQYTLITSHSISSNHHQMIKTLLIIMKTDVIRIQFLILYKNK